MISFNYISSIIFIILAVVSYQQKLSIYVTTILGIMAVTVLLPLLPIFSASSDSDDPVVNSDMTCSGSSLCINDKCPANIYVSSVPTGDGGSTGVPQGLSTQKCIPDICYSKLTATTEFPKWNEKSDLENYPYLCGSYKSDYTKHEDSFAHKNSDPVCDHINENKNNITNLITTYPNSICELTGNNFGLDNSEAIYRFETINDTICNKDLYNVAWECFKNSEINDDDTVNCDKNKKYSTVNNMKDEGAPKDIYDSIENVADEFGNETTAVQLCSLLKTTLGEQQNISKSINNTVGLESECKYPNCYSITLGKKIDSKSRVINEPKYWECPKDGWQGESRWTKNFDSICTTNFLNLPTDKNLKNLKFIKANTIDVEYKNGDETLLSSTGIKKCGVAIPNKIQGGTTSSFWASGDTQECKQSTNEFLPYACIVPEKSEEYPIKCIGGGSDKPSCIAQYSNTDIYYPPLKKKSTDTFFIGI
jgi:hypothetical protein